MEGVKPLVVHWRIPLFEENLEKIVHIEADVKGEFIKQIIKFLV